MMKWLLIALVVGVALWWITRGRGGSRSGSSPARDEGSRADGGSHARSTPGSDAGRGSSGGQAGPAGRPTPPAEPQPMVRCAHCGLMLPRQEALPGPDEHHYCGAEHLRLGPPRREGPGS